MSTLPDFPHLPPDEASPIAAYDAALADGTLVIADFPHDQPVMNGVNPYEAG